MSVVTIFRLDTGGADAGEHIRTGNANDPKTADLIALGHTVVNARYNHFYKYDYATNTVVLDTAKEQAQTDRRNRKDMLNARRQSHLATLQAGVGTNRALPEINAVLDMLIEYQEKI